MVGETKDTAPKLGEDMTKIATKMVARLRSECPACHKWISKGTNIKVYNNKWLHTKCWSDVKDKKKNIKGSQKIISNIIKKFPEGTILKPPVNHVPQHKVMLEEFTNKIIDSLGVINKEIESIWEYIGNEKLTADEYNERSNSNN